MNANFWQRCVDAECVIVPVKVYARFTESGHLSNDDLIGIKYGIIEQEVWVAGPDFYYYISHQDAGPDWMHDTPELALAHQEQKMKIKSLEPR